MDRDDEVQGRPAYTAPDLPASRAELLRMYRIARAGACAYSTERGRDRAASIAVRIAAALESA